MRRMILVVVLVSILGSIAFSASPTSVNNSCGSGSTLSKVELNNSWGR